MRRTFVCLTVSVLSATILCGCQSASKPPQPVAAIQPTPTTQRQTPVVLDLRDLEAREAKEREAARQFFARPVADASLKGTSFNEVLDGFREQCHVNIFVNWRALKGVGVQEELPITVGWTNLTLGEALTKLLKEVGAPSVQLAYSLDTGVITISTADDIARNVCTRVYDIRRALGKEHRDEDVAAIVRRVQGIYPLSWKANGGTIGDCRELSGQLIVTQTPEVQKRISTELEEYAQPYPRPLVSDSRR